MADCEHSRRNDNSGLCQWCGADMNKLAAAKAPSAPKAPAVLSPRDFDRVVSAVAATVVERLGEDFEALRKRVLDLEQRNEAPKPEG